MSIKSSLILLYVCLSSPIIKEWHLCSNQLQTFFMCSCLDVERQVWRGACAVNLFLNVDKARAGDYAGRGKSSGTLSRITNTVFADWGENGRILIATTAFVDPLRKEKLMSFVKALFMLHKLHEDCQSIFQLNQHTGQARLMCNSRDMLNVECPLKSFV